MKKYSLLKTYDLNSGNVKTLHTFEGVIEAPNWLKDKDTILYNADGRIYKYSVSKDTITEMNTGICRDCNNDHVPSPDNRELAISNFTGGIEKGASEIYRVPMEGGIPELVTKKTPSYLHGWSHDGKDFVYCAIRDEKVDIYTIPSDGGEEICLTDGHGYNDGPEYAPDDRHVWFTSTRDGLMQIYRMNRDGSNMQQITSDEGYNNWFPHISPDGNRVVYLSFQKEDVKPWEHLPDKNVNLWIMDYSGTKTSHT